MRQQQRREESVGSLENWNKFKLHLDDVLPFLCRRLILLNIMAYRTKTFDIKALAGSRLNAKADVVLELVATNLLRDES